MLVGVIIAAQLIWPDLTKGIPWLGYGRLRPLHTNAVIFAFGGCTLFDSTDDGLANFAMCAITGAKDSTSPQSSTLYSCKDVRTDRCANPTVVVAPVRSAETTCADLNKSQTAAFYADPDNDTRVYCTITLADVDGNGALDLVVVGLRGRDGQIRVGGPGDLEQTRDLLLGDLRPATDASRADLTGANLNGTNDFSGGVTVGGGTVNAGTNTAFGSGSLTVNAGTVNLGTATIGNTVFLNGGTIAGGTINLATTKTLTAKAGTLSSLLAGDGSLSKTDNGTLLITGDNTGFAGATVKP